MSKELVLKFATADYFKLKNVDIERKVSLLEVIVVQAEDLSKDFRAYDATYKMPDGTLRQYPLPPTGPLLMLLFLDANNTLFTTMRDAGPRKEYHYRSNIGNYFTIKIEPFKK